MYYKGLMLFVSAMLVLFLVSACADDVEVVLDDGQCRTLLLSKCDQCHYIARVCQKLGEKNSRNWGRTIQRMVSNGAKLTEEEKKTLVACLSSQSDETKEACR